MNLTDADLDALLKRLNLANARRIWSEMVVRAETEDWSCRQFLEVLVGEEVAHRQRTRLQRCTRAAKFPFLKTIDEFDFQFQSQLRLSLLGSYLSPDFVTEGRGLILYGRSGRGKTHLAVAIAFRAIQNGFEALFTTAAALIDDLSRASREGRFREVLQRYSRVHVLVIDEVGYLSYGPDAANVLFHVVNERQLAHRPIVITTNKPLAAWGEVLHDPDLAEAIVDRILERGRFLVLDGPSLRTRHIDPDLLSQPARISGTHTARSCPAAPAASPSLRKARLRPRPRDPAHRPMSCWPSPAPEPWRASNAHRADEPRSSLPPDRPLDCAYWLRSGPAPGAAQSTQHGGDVAMRQGPLDPEDSIYAHHRLASQRAPDHLNGWVGQMRDVADGLVLDLAVLAVGPPQQVRSCRPCRCTAAWSWLRGLHYPVVPWSEYTAR